MQKVIDRKAEAPVLMASSQGGMEIETVAAESPEAILFERLDPIRGLEPFQGRRLATRLGLPSTVLGAFGKLALNFVRAFLSEDCSLGEINPLVLTAQAAW